MMTNKLLTTILCLVMPMLGVAQKATFTAEQQKVDNNLFDVVLKGTIDFGWHVYSTDLNGAGPTEAAIFTEKAVGVEPVGTLKAEGKEIKAYDRVFGAELRYFEHSVTFRQRYRITAKSYSLEGYLEYGLCNDRECMPPTTCDFAFSGVGAANDKSAAEEGKSGQPDGKDGSQADGKDGSQADGKDGSDTEKNAAGNGDDQQEASAEALNDSAAAALTDSLSAAADSTASTLSPAALTTDDAGEGGSGSLWHVLIMGFLGGLIALLTPCVWPIIPMTVSFFLKRTSDRGKAIRDAMTYGASIIAIFLILGLMVTALLGENALNAMATNAVFNLIFCALLVVFALSFFGWFELTLPSSWANKVDQKATATTGLLSIFLMAFTLVLVSFSCTGPIVGFLLVDFATRGNWLAPTIGMLGFSFGLALPFTLFALFPSWLKQAPRSGSWMNMLKVTLGFIELAFACKFFSVADLAYHWHLMDREVFLAIWIALALVLALYLFGILRFQSDGEERKARPVAAIMTGIASLAFALYLVPGLWGAPCNAVSAFAPPMSTQTFRLGQQQVEALYTDFDEAAAEARRTARPLLIDFTGYGCVNCRKMEATVWTDPEVARLLTRDYVLVSLYVDDKTRLDEPIVVTRADGTTRKLRTVGDKWSWFEQQRYGHLTQPYYVAVDADGNVLTTPVSYDEDARAYARFLRKGLEQYNIIYNKRQR